jgi:hypothetical protein
MKHSIVALLIICSSFIAKAQTKSTKLVGTWQLTSFSISGNTVTEGFKRYKSFTPTHFIVTDIDPTSNATRTSIFGTYALTDTTYTEHLLHLNKENAAMTGQTYPGSVIFDGDDTMTFKTTFNGQKMEEHWKLVKAE